MATRKIAKPGEAAGGRLGGSVRVGREALLVGLVAGLVVLLGAPWARAASRIPPLLAAAEATAARVAERVTAGDPHAWGERFGVAAPGDPQLPARLGVRWYYDYRPLVGDAPAGQVKAGTLRGGERNGAPLPEVRAEARLHPGRYWLIFNEPDLAEQDRVPDAFLAARGEDRFAYYARRYHEYRTTLRGADPTAKLVGPNLFNLDEHFDEWLDGFRAAHRARYGEEPAFDVWSFHIYVLDWQRAPMLDREYALRTVERFRSYVGGLPGGPSRIWLTEFGTLWAWDRAPVCLRPDCGCAEKGEEGRCRAQFEVPAHAHYAAAEVSDYVAWLVDELALRGVERWFFFAGQPMIDAPFMAPPFLANGPSLFDGAGRLTPIGVRYRRLIERGPPLGAQHFRGYGSAVAESVR